VAMDGSHACRTEGTTKVRAATIAAEVRRGVVRRWPWLDAGRAASATVAGRGRWPGLDAGRAMSATVAGRGRIRAVAWSCDRAVRSTRRPPGGGPRGRDA
jgi:hypothetical protein